MSQQKQEMEEGKEKEKYENDENQNRIMSFEDFETRMLHDFETLTKRFQNEMENYFTKFKLEIKAEFAKNLAAAMAGLFDQSSKANVDREHDGKQRQSDRTGRLSEGIVDKTAENNDASKSARMSASDGFLMAKTEVKREVETPPPIIQKPPSKEQKSVNETSDKTPNKRFFSIHGPKPVTGLSLTVKNAPSRQSIAKKVD
uniref:Uncharacterized protein n=1 Tax=Panagrolaimus sp. JU765 TaxID=591449 RepID=A0AC34RLY1_9BILA